MAPRGESRDRLDDLLDAGAGGRGQREPLDRGRGFRRGRAQLQLLLPPARRHVSDSNWKGKRAIVIGTGNSGHDIAQDLHSSGANVTLFQRSSTLVVSIEPSAQLVYAPYNEGTLEDNDLIATSMPLKLARKKDHALTAEKSKALDAGIARRPGAQSASSSISAKTIPAGNSNISRAAAAIISTSAAPT